VTIQSPSIVITTAAAWMRREDPRISHPLLWFSVVESLRYASNMVFIQYITVHYSTNVFILLSPIHARGTRSDRSLLQAPIRKKLGRARAATEQLGGASQDVALPVLYRKSFRTRCAPLCPPGGGLAGEGDAGEAIPCVRNCTVQLQYVQYGILGAAGGHIQRYRRYSMVLPLQHRRGYTIVMFSGTAPYIMDQVSISTSTMRRRATPSFLCDATTTTSGVALRLHVRRSSSSAGELLRAVVLWWETVLKYPVVTVLARVLANVLLTVLLG
jgi:hypothetical protein